ncbi:patatin-like phospholipase family protein [Ramlibacter sp. XY19]|uniref:patatin-like phospholipase family protein n=1 Tax=Ramlibacter paludis TaxID=2908000 RepID=UPI0023D98C9D|nr:patatin-like phospholipase family protein [Ramlibacter paludis]MCG2593581.1 patatin-like phospholipase family protein [Ramlibacter paludis]
MPALRIYAGPAARRHLEKQGLQPADVGVVPAAAGGPKGLVLGPLDRFLFGQWLPQTDHPVHLVGASIGAWRMATACLREPVAAFERLERDYIAQHYEPAPGRKTPSATQVSDAFAQSLESFYGGRIREVLTHPRFRLHIVTSRGRHVLRRQHRVATPLGYLGAFVSNSLHRKAMGAWLERVVFSTPEEGGACTLPFGTGDYPTRQVLLTEANFQPALQASCSIPFVLNAVHDIPGAPPGAYWDGGITDYHLHLKYDCGAGPNLVLYPHFQKAVVPGWLDKGLKWRHRATAFLDSMVVLAPDPEWVKSLPNGKLPDRTDFTRYGSDLQARVRDWTAAVRASTQLAEEFAAWLAKPDPARVEAL